ncbi:MAG: hypothetical protein ACT4OY_05165 [Alphaproteobacteria bacterium]
MTISTRILYSGLCAAALVTALAMAPAMAETRLGTSASSSTGLGVNADTGLSVGAGAGTNTNTNGSVRIQDDMGSSTYSRTRVSSNVDAKLDTNNNGFIDENEIKLSSNTRARTRNSTNAGIRDLGPVFGMGGGTHAKSDNRIGASLGND